MSLIEIPFFTPSSSQSTVIQPIPKKIYQTWKTRFVTPKIADAIQNIIKTNPTYEYYFFGDEECKEYLRKNYPPEYEQAFDELIPGAFKSDFWRYAILAKEGGVYIDLDLKPFFGFDDLIMGYDFVSIKDRGHDNAIYQAFIATIPNHPFVVNTLNQCLKNIVSHYHGYQFLGITGPLLMGEEMCKILNIDKIYPGSFKSNKFGDYTIYLFVDEGYDIFPTKSVDGKFIMNKSKKRCIVNQNNIEIFGADKVEGYKSNSNYAFEFHKRKIYRNYDNTVYLIILICVFVLLLMLIKKLYGIIRHKFYRK